MIFQQPAKDFGADFEGEAITEDDLKKIAPCWYPVHAMGYNWLQSNAISGKKIAERIKGLIQGYQKRGFKCEKVIVVTHSMGGLVARALIHPDYGNLQDSILGVYHNVMPTIGAAGACKRMRFGFQEKNGGIFGLSDTIQAAILGPDGANATAILANASAPLEMLPGELYGPSWLKVVDGRNRTLAMWPNVDKKETALNNIYLQPKDAWWRLVNPDWVNPGGQKSDRKKKMALINGWTTFKIALKWLQNSSSRLRILFTPSLTPVTVPRVSV